MDFTKLHIKGLQGASVISAGDSVKLKPDQWAFYIGVSLTAASKTVTLDLPEGAVAIVANEGSNAFTLKNVSGDSGTDMTAAATFLVRASQTADGSKFLAVEAPAAETS